jgi:NADH dehydrogenase
MAKTVVVVGGSGFVGRHLVQRLARSGRVVRAVVRRPESAKFLRPMGDVGQVTAVAVDLADDRSVAAAIGRADEVVNLVGILYESGRQTFQTIQAEAPGRIGRAAAAGGARSFVQMSAIGASADSAALYARSKAAGEAAARAAYPAATVLRPSIVFGPEDQFFNRFASLARFTPALPLFGGGLTRFQPVYVGDVADAIMAVLDDPTHAGRDFSLGGPRIHSFKELMAMTLEWSRRRRALVSVPWAVTELQAAVLGHLPVPPLTPDQVAMLKVDNVVPDGAPGLADLGLAATAIEAIVPGYLARFWPGGRFGARRDAPA